MTGAIKQGTHADFYALDAKTTQQTIDESVIETSIDMGAFTIHHGKRFGQPIVIAEHHDQKTDELSAVWYADMPVAV